MKKKSSYLHRYWLGWLGGAALMLMSSGCVVTEETGTVAYGPGNPYPDPYFASYWGPYDTGYWGYRRRSYHGRAVWRAHSYYRHGAGSYAHGFHGGGGHGGGGHR